MGQRQQVQGAASVPLAEGAEGTLRRTEGPCRAGTQTWEERGPSVWDQTSQQGRQPAVDRAS